MKEKIGAKQIAALLIILIGFPAFIGREPAKADGEGACLTVEPIGEVTPGEELVVSVNLTGSQNVAAVEFWMHYDSEKLVLTSAREGSAVADVSGGQAAIFSPLDARSHEPEGTVFFQWDSTKAKISSEGSLLELRFAVNENAAGDSSVILSEAYAYDPAFNEIPLQCTDGVLSAAHEPVEAETPDRKAVEEEIQAPGAAAPGAQEAESDAIQIDEAGKAEASGAVQGLRQGDLNGDGVVQAEDVRIARDIAAQLTACEEWQRLAGDLNADGRINVKDVNLIRRYVEKGIPWNET